VRTAATIRAPRDLGLHEVLRRARRAGSVTQSALAEAVGCRQSAISMFEAGRADALAWDKVQRMAAHLDVDLSSFAGPAVSSLTVSAIRLAYCPAHDCPSNVPYVVGGRPCLKPRLVSTHEGGPGHCRLCGEVLETRCPNEGCRADICEGAFCPFCGSAYVSGLPGMEYSPARVERRRRSIAELFELTATHGPILGKCSQQGNTTQTKPDHPVRGRQP